MDSNANPNSGQNANSNPRQQVADKIKQANNVLVTVSNNPSIDQLAAAIGLTILVNKLGKHGTAVFSGEVPSTIEFLKPEETLEKNTDSLRDFIIALDKSKADKLRYKVEDKVVKIFITPYKASISDKDLDFSYGDFNVDVVVALGVHKQQDLDQAITAHGRILHDATILSINNSPNGDLGNINWLDTSASSLSELVAGLDGEIGKASMDGQIATALLTGIVAETNRFSNDKTTPQTMSVSAKLMSAGANQQLVVSKLEPSKPKTSPPPPPAEPPKPNAPAPEMKPAPAEEEKPADKQNNDGTLQISHDDNGGAQTEDSPQPPDNQIAIDTEGNLHSMEENDQTPVAPSVSTSSVTGGSPMAQEPPRLGSPLSANIEPERLDPSTDPLSSPGPEVKLPDINWQEQNSDSKAPPVEVPPAQPAAVPLPSTNPSNLFPVDSQPEPPKPAEQPAPEGLSLPPQPPLPQVTPEPRSQVSAPPATAGIMTGSENENLPTLDMPMPSAPQQASDLVSPFGEEEKPSGMPSNPNGPPPPPVPPPPPSTVPPVF